MSPRTLFATLATVTAVCLPAPAAAQSAGFRGTHAPRIVATYDFGATRHAIALPMTVTVADSAGTLVANVTIAGEHVALPMQVTVIESDLVLQGETRDGLLTLVLDNQAEGGVPKAATGRWALGSATGRLRTRG